MPPIVTATLALVQLAVQLAPVAEKAYENARQLFKMWFDGGLITVEQQSYLMGWADAHEKAVLAGEVPPELTVEPDPT
jgi:hypothetical protein